jgi:hypothetical protein
MTRTWSSTLGLVACLGACAVPVENEAEQLEVDALVQALEADEHLVALRTINGRYLTAENSGGSTVSANRTAIGPWERFIMKHQWPDEIETGDTVQLRIADGTGKLWWLVAESGGGPGSILRANRTAPSTWETFRIWKPTGDDDILSGDTVHLQSSTTPYYVCAEDGGGRSGDGSVVVNRTTPLGWESFTIQFL